MYLSVKIGITVIFIFHSFFFFSSYARFSYLPLFPFSLSFILWSAGTAKYTFLLVLFCFCFFCLISLGMVVWPRLCDQSLFQDLGEFCAFHFLGRFLFAHLFKLELLTQLLVDHPPHLWLEHQFNAFATIYLNVSSLSSHNLHLSFCCVFSILALTGSS